MEQLCHMHTCTSCAWHIETQSCMYYTLLLVHSGAVGSENSTVHENECDGVVSVSSVCSYTYEIFCTQLL